MRPFILALGLLASAHVHAQSLADVLERAWQRTPQAQSQAVREEGLAANRALASSLFPEAPAVALAHQTDRFDSNAGAREYEVELAVPLWLPGQKPAARELAESESAQFSAEQSVARLELAGQVREAVWQVRLAETATQLARARLAAYRQIEDDVARRVKAGELAHADLLLARGETIAVQTELSAAEQALLEVRQDYLQLVGDDRLPADAVETAPGVQAIDTHPRLLASARRVEAARARAQLTARTGRENPELALLARRERGDADERYGNAFGVAIRIPLGTAARNAPRMAVAQAELTEAETEHARLREALEQAQRKAQAEMDSARTRAELAEARLVLARENQALAKKAFSLGEKSLFEFQRVQSALDESALAAGQAAIEQHRAQARLNQASGVLP